MNALDVQRVCNHRLSTMHSIHTNGAMGASQYKYLSACCNLGFKKAVRQSEKREPAPVQLYLAFASNSALRQAMLSYVSLMHIYIV